MRGCVHASKPRTRSPARWTEMSRDDPVPCERLYGLICRRSMRGRLCPLTRSTTQPNTCFELPAAHARLARTSRCSKLLIRA